MLETWVQFLGWEDPLQKEMATHSSILAWKGAWQTTVHGVTKCQTRLRYWTEHIYMGFRKIVTTTLYVRQQKRHRCVEQSFGLCGRGRGMIWENGIETCIISYKKQITNTGSMQDTGCLGLVHWDDPEGWYGEGGGFRIGNTCMPVADSCWCMAKPIQYCKVISLQLK